MALPAIIAGAMRGAARLGEGLASGVIDLARFAKQDLFGGSITKRIDKALNDNSDPTQGGKSAENARRLSINFKDLNQQLAFATVNAHGFTNIIQAIPGKFVATMTLSVDALAKAAAPFVELVGRNNPAVTRQFALALNDAYGVLGRMLIPVVQSFTRTARSLGNTLAGLEPVFKPLISNLASFADLVGKTVVDAVRENAAAFELLAEALGATLTSLRPAVKLLGILAQPPLLSGLNGIARLLGYGGAFDPTRTGMGAGIRSAKQVSAADELQNEAIKNALMAGAGAGESDEKQQTNYLEKIAGYAGNIWNFLSTFEKVKERGGSLDNAMRYTNPLYSLYSLFRTS